MDSGIFNTIQRAVLVSIQNRLPLFAGASWAAWP
jgi:hypothetical protein